MFLTRARRGLPAVAFVVGCLAGIPGSGYADQKQPEKPAQPKLSKEERQDAEAMVKLVDGVMTGQAGPDAQAFPLGWHNDFLKATEGVYVPFIITIDPTAISPGSVVFYLRVVKRESEASDAGAAQDKAKTVPAAPYAYEDVWFPDLKRPQSGQKYELARAFAVPAGDYDVFVGVRERTKDKKVTPKSSVLKQPVTVPDFWNGELTTSSVILAQSVEPLEKPLSPAEQVEHPYTIGQMEITPALNHTFTKKDELSVLFLVYNPALKDKKPDVTVEYKFHQKTADGEKYFNRTPPTVLNADTVPPNFDLDAGHQLVAGQAVPLASFPAGDYRLEIEVQDKLGQKTLTRDVFFTVTDS
jgi:hypothetical protein